MKIVLINNEEFEILKVNTNEAVGDSWIGTKASDPSFLKGKRTVFTRYLEEAQNGYSYDWDAK